MYKIVGADGRPYGPVTADQVREWIATGRANARTLAQSEGATEWKPLTAYPEFVEALAAQAAPPPVSPSAADHVDPNALADEVLKRDYTVDISGSLSRAWDLITRDFWPIIGISALVMLILAATNAAYVGLILTGPLIGGLNWYYLKRIRGQQAGINDAFAGFTMAFVQLLLTSLVSGLLVGVGLLFCLLPGICLAVAWCLAIPLVIDRKLPFWDALEVSRKVVTKHWWSFLGLILVFALVNLGGTLLCCVGSFLTTPLTLVALMYVYEDVFASRQTSTALIAPTPSQMPPLSPGAGQTPP